MDFPQSYNDALDIYTDRLRNSTLSRGVKLANNTYLTWDIPAGEDCASWFGVRLHDTNVVTFHDDGRIELDSGGWDTVTTKSRMNACLLQYGVFANNGTWYVSDDQWAHKKRCLPIPTKCLGMKKAYGRREFEDGMTLHPEGLWHDEEKKYDEQI
jgi:hypothetical protein